MHAKEIFLKELSAIGRKLGKQEDAKDTKSRIKNKKDPIKLRLENITAEEFVPVQRKTRSASPTTSQWLFNQLWHLFIQKGFWGFGGTFAVTPEETETRALAA